MGQSKTLNYCVRCGALLPIQQNGRPRRCCPECKASYRKIQKQKQYQRVKFPGLNNEEIESKLKEFEKAKQQKEDWRFIRKELRFLIAHLSDKGLEPERLLDHSINAAYIGYKPKRRSRRK